MKNVDFYGSNDVKGFNGKSLNPLYSRTFRLLVISASFFSIHFLLFVFSFTACTNQETIPAMFKNPAVEVITVYSINDTDAEVTVSFSEVYQIIPEVGVVWSDKANPTITDNSQLQKSLKQEVDVTFSMPNLQPNKTYFIRGYFKLNEKITYSQEIQFVPNYSELWIKIDSPTLGPNEYISPEDVITGNYDNNFQCYKVNRLTNNSVLQTYFRYNGGWNPSAFTTRPNPAPRAMLYNPIYVQFESANKILSLYGGGYQQLPQNRGLLYKRAMYILESDGVWEPYPGAEARTSVFGIGNVPYILENVANGNVWVFDFSVLKWKAIAKVPTTKPARLIAFDYGERAFVLVEPTDPTDLSQAFYEYIPAEKRWERKADFVGEARRFSSGMVINGKVFFGLGLSVKDKRPLRDIWEYKVGANSWTKKTNYPGAGTLNNFVVNNYLGYIGFGQQYKLSSVGGEDYKQVNDLWQFLPY